MKTIKVFCNLIYGAWSAKQLETGIGGSEEKLIEWAREMAKDDDVTIYMNGEYGIFDGVKYEPHSNYTPWEYCDVFISFKNRDIWTQSINAGKKIHWTTEVETWEPWMLNNVDEVICISDYHRNRMLPKSDKFRTQYLWADFKRITYAYQLSKENNYIPKDDDIVIRFDGNGYIKEKNSMLYCSSFDRGLEELLTYWPQVKEKLGVKKLYITYGMEMLKSLAKQNPHLFAMVERLEGLIKQEGVEMVGKLSNDEMCKMYWKCQYWCLPLNNPDSELFCINSIKASYAGCIPVLRKIGALQETNLHCINWDEIIGKPNQKSDWTDKSLEQNRKFAEKFSLDIKIQEWKKLLNIA